MDHMTKTITTIMLWLAFALAGCTYVNNNTDGGGGETGGEWSEGPLEGEHPPEWVCRERAPNVTLAGHDDPIPALERCYYSPHGKDLDGDGDNGEPWAWPGKPHWQKLPSLMHWLDNPEPTGHPVYEWSDPNANPWTPGFHLHKSTPSAPWLPDVPHDFRSGLVGNFALWIGGVPNSGNRPPIVTASFIDVTNFDLPTIVGHPFYEGRYNAYGYPCSTNPPIQANASEIGWSLLMVPHSSSPNAECKAFVEYYSVAAAHPLYPLGADEDTMIGVAQDESQCLDNGGVYKVSEAALTAATRNGLIWINWGEFWEDFVLWLQQTHPEIHALIVALDYLQGTGWNSWPVDPPYPYNNWSVTGECSHPARLGVYGTSIRTAVPCPVGMLAVFPEFDPKEVVEWEESVHGYCTLPWQMAPPPGVAFASPIDIISTGKPGQGFDGAKWLNLDGLSQARLDTWMDAITVTSSAAGLEVQPANALGVDLLAALDIPAGSKIVGVNNLPMINAPDGTPAATTTEAAWEVDRAVMAGELIWLLIDAPNGWRLHRYIVPYVPEYPNVAPRRALLNDQGTILDLTVAPPAPQMCCANPGGCEAAPSSGTCPSGTAMHTCSGTMTCDPSDPDTCWYSCTPTTGQ